MSLRIAAMLFWHQILLAYQHVHFRSPLHTFPKSWAVYGFFADQVIASIHEIDPEVVHKLDAWRDAIRKRSTEDMANL